ncbi:hypothetical protein SAMN05660642_01114 [Geodermatophilus siccatus]|uniref:Uncharacterized protein n=1 Tax=Geodermatophilus siccatus TaxID=1137991 RepID=A0A1G9NN87_9ACTN|nr:hypothetical protein [Geodermatophilus siccatus]SDL88056.1 hypothetical protein SAMN05660642_01114 [Geodermatophilus siccatus]
MTEPRPTSDRHDRQVLTFAPPYERDGTSVITATAARSHTATRRAGVGREDRGFDAEMSGSRPMGAFVLRDGRVRWHPVVDVTRVLTTAELVVGGVLTARRLAARPSAAKATVTMGPGGWVSMKGGVMAVRPARRAWRRTRPAGAGPLPRRPWWARLLAATALESVLG